MTKSSYRTAKADTQISNIHVRKLVGYPSSVFDSFHEQTLRVLLSVLEEYSLLIRT